MKFIRNYRPSPHHAILCHGHIRLGPRPYSVTAVDERALDTNHDLIA